jgi:hypothetical protein
MDAEFECIACNVKRIVIAVTPVAKGYEMRSLECPQCSNLLRLVLRHPRSYSKTLGRRLSRIAHRHRHLKIRWTKWQRTKPRLSTKNLSA